MELMLFEPPVPAPASEDLLVIARHDANKNLVGLLKALATAQQRLPQWRGVLRIVGRGVVDSAELQALCRALPRPEGLELIKELSPNQLLSILAAVWPSCRRHWRRDLITRCWRPKQKGSQHF